MDLEGHMSAFQLGRTGHHVNHVGTLILRLVVSRTTLVVHTTAGGEGGTTARQCSDHCAHGNRGSNDDGGGPRCSSYSRSGDSAYCSARRKTPGGTPTPGMPIIVHMVYIGISTRITTHIDIPLDIAIDIRLDITIHVSTAHIDIAALPDRAGGDASYSSRRRSRPDRTLRGHSSAAALVTSRGRSSAAAPVTPRGRSSAAASRRYSVINNKQLKSS